MALLVPFHAIRPTPAVAARVAAVPYDVVSTEEARRLAAGNPLSFLHVSRPEIDLPEGTDPHADLVYRRAAANFATLTASAPLVLEADPSLFVYRLVRGTHAQTGVAACFSVDEYESEAIRKHERTRRDKEDDRTRHIDAVGAQTGPVFLTYRATALVDTLVDRVTRGVPLFDFVADDDVRHVIWKVGDERSRLIEAFAGIPTLYIADGHHRAASAARVRRQHCDAGRGAGEWDTFLAVAFPDNQMQVLPYNRIVRDLGGPSTGSGGPEGPPLQTPAKAEGPPLLALKGSGASVRRGGPSGPPELLDRIRERFQTIEGPAVPQRRGQVAMFLEGRWYTIELGAPEADASVEARLDVSRLQDEILAPLLGIADPRSDTRIEFVGGVRGTAALEAAVTSGRAAVAFSLHPVAVDDLMRISDAGGIMPPKSTWFEPKLRDGLLSHMIEPKPRAQRAGPQA